MNEDPYEYEGLYGTPKDVSALLKKLRKAGWKLSMIRGKQYYLSRLKERSTVASPDPAVEDPE